MTTQTTKVIFKRCPEGDVIALFPTLPGTRDPYSTCMSYMHTGQHGHASTDLFTLPPAQPAEYADLAARKNAL